jgi:dipeptidyl aminopeptidase/acylaminoacyl peptidase
VQAVCDWYGPTDLLAIVDQSSRRDANAPDSPVSLLLGGPPGENPEKAAQASPVSYVSKDDPPFLIMHGTEDPVVPYPQSVLLREALEKTGIPVELVPLEGARHGGKEFRAPEILRRVKKFFASFLTCKELR